MESQLNTHQTPGAYANVNGIKMYYEIHGAGHPLVLIHGGGSTLQTSFGTILPVLAKTHLVIAVEMQAHGHTGDRNAPETFVQDADDIGELLTQLHIASADILGFSNGGQTALEMALRHPGRVRKLIIASAFYKRSGAPAGFWDGFEDATLDSMPQVYKDEFRKINNNEAALLNMFNKDVHRMANFKDWSDDAIRSIDKPALVVAGDQDLPSHEHTVGFARLLPQGRLAILLGNHGSYIGEAMSAESGSKVPELFVALVDEFLA